MEPKRLRKRSSFNISVWIPYVILIVLIIFMNIYQPGLVTFKWINRQMDAWVSLALVAIGQTLVFMIGGTDLSLGGVICFTNCLAAISMQNSGASILGVSLAVVAIGAFAGFVNGLVIVKLKLQPFIATLATWAIW